MAHYREPKHPHPAPKYTLELTAEEGRMVALALRERGRALMLTPPKDIPAIRSKRLALRYHALADRVEEKLPKEENRHD